MRATELSEMQDRIPKVLKRLVSERHFLDSFCCYFQAVLTTPDPKLLDSSACSKPAAEVLRFGGRCALGVVTDPLAWPSELRGIQCSAWVVGFCCAGVLDGLSFSISSISILKRLGV